MLNCALNAPALLAPRAGPNRQNSRWRPRAIGRPFVPMDTTMSGFDRGLEIVGVADILAGVDIDQDRSHSSLLSLRFPQWWGLRSGLNSRTLWRFKALMTPMRASIVGPSDDSATRIKTSTAVCHSSICCSAFGSFWIYLAASSRVTSWRPRGSGIGSSNSRFQPRLLMTPTLLSRIWF